MSSRTNIALPGLVALAVVAGATEAWAQSAQLSVESREIYADLPFVLAVAAEDFDEAPEPTISKLEIPGCRVQYLGVSPSVSRSMSIINGVRSSTTRVTFVYRYRIEASRAGNYQVPAMTVEQGTKKASTPSGTFSAKPISKNASMKIRLNLPDRPVWVGETVPISVDWYLRSDPKSPSFVIPLFDREDWVTVQAPEGVRGEGSLGFNVGARELELPYTQTKATVDGTEYSRFSFRALVTPVRAGTLELSAARVVSRLQVGVGRDRFGRRGARTSIFKAEDEPRKLTVRPLPLTGRPASFANAVGSGFSIDVQASDTVVQVGDPVELTITIRGNTGLEGIGLPPLDVDGGLPPDQFSIADDQPAGELLEDGGKKFVVTVRLKSAAATVIPALGFAYFDPEAGEYRTVRSREIALSVAGSAVVGAGDVVGSAASRKATGDPTRAGSDPAGTTNTNNTNTQALDLVLSDGDTLDRPLKVESIQPVLIALYVLPLLVFGGRSWQLRTRGRRTESGDLRRRKKDLGLALADATSANARDAAPRIARALKALARGSGIPGTGELSERLASLVQELDNTGFDPRAAESPLDPALVKRAGELARDIEAAGTGSRASGKKGGASAAIALVLGGLTLGIASQGFAAEELEGARAAYYAALEEKDADERRRGFARAELALRAAVDKTPDRPALLTDWGNAALGAGDLGRATLAYRRALHHDGSLERARKNLEWVRTQGPSWLQRPSSAGAMDSLFFWHRQFTRAQRHLAAALAFALVVLLLVPWNRSRARTFRRLSVLPALVFVAMITSLVLERDGSQDGVLIVDDVVLRSADSGGAPPVSTNPLPVGAEMVVLETRGSWTRIRLPDGTHGWIPAGTVERVAI